MNTWEVYRQRMYGCCGGVEGIVNDFTFFNDVD